ncbi:MAG: hypothetical protein Q4D35_03135 [Ruminococcus sp.]|nr:hypothetical protein [Ruminococcus sp.]
MKKIILAISALMTMILCGCELSEDNHSYIFDDTEYEVYLIDMGMETVYIVEWISPDGVHYWCTGNTTGNSMAPRYDNNGNLVVDK